MSMFEEYDYLPDHSECRQYTAGEWYDMNRFRQAVIDALSEPGRIVEFLIDFTRQEIRATPDGRVERRFVNKTPHGREFGQWEDIPRQFLPPYTGLHAVSPWIVDGCVVLDSNRHPVADCKIRGRSSVECAANAALIAAAPDLLDVLQAMVACIETANNEGNSILSAWLPDARAAIAKAALNAAPK